MGFKQKLQKLRTKILRKGKDKIAHYAVCSIISELSYIIANIKNIEHWIVLLFGVLFSVISETFTSGTKNNKFDPLDALANFSPFLVFYVLFKLINFLNYLI